jgi:sigma-B regulation protein RsbU (phosphoserine phosphatase)
MRFWKKKDKGPYPRSFAKRLTWRIMITLFIVMGIITAIIVCLAWIMGLAGGAMLLRNVVDDKANGVEQTLAEVYVATVNTAPNIEDNLHRPDRMEDIMKRLVEQNPHIRSCGISFRENYYPQKGRWFCPYAQRRDSDSIVVSQTIGGIEHDYLKEAWFQEGMKAKDGYWAKPFFDGTDHETPLVAFLMPIRDEHDSTVAVLGVDMSLEMLARSISPVFFDGKDYSDQWSAEEKMYYFVVDSTGTFLVHPYKKYMVNQNFYEMTRKSATTTDDYAAEMIQKDGESGYIFGDDRRHDNITIDGEKVMVCYTTIEHTPWKMVMVIPNYYVEVVLYSISGLFLFFILVGLLVVFFVGRKGIKKSSEPLRQLAVSANEVAKGKFDAPLPEVKSRDEIHLLRDSFGQMQHS